MQEEILKTLTNPHAIIKDYPKYVHVMEYFTNNPHEISLYILTKAYQQVQANPQNNLLNYIKDINFCLNSAYEYIYYFELNEHNKLTLNKL